MSKWTRQKNKRGDTKAESNHNPEIPDRHKGIRHPQPRFESSWGHLKTDSDDLSDTEWTVWGHPKTDSADLSDTEWTVSGHPKTDRGDSSDTELIVWGYPKTDSGDLSDTK